MESVTLFKPTENCQFDATKCIICQDHSNGKTVSTENGRKRIREASDIRCDTVSKRLKLVQGDEFVYHMTNKCYKEYTLKKTLETLTKKKMAPIPSSSTEGRRSRGQVVRHPPIAKTTVTALRDVKCIICDNKSYKREYDKYRISESDRASYFLAATNFFQDDVFTRTCDLQDTHSVFGADLFYHKGCIKKYLYKFESRDKNMQPPVSKKQQVWSQLVKELDEGLKSGKGYELNVIRDRLNSIDSECNFRNRDVKVYLTNQFGKEIEFTPSYAGPKSMMVFRVEKQVLAESIRSEDPIQVCATVIRKALDEYDFGLEDSFCDAQDLKVACTEMEIPEPIVRFFGHLYNFKPDTYKQAANSIMTDEKLTTELPAMDDGENNDDADEEASDGNQQSFHGSLSVSRCRKVQSLFQIMYYVHHCGRKRTPMHIMNAESVHALGRGGKIVTQTLNHEGLAISYPELRRYQHDLASFTAHHNEAQVALPCHFDPGQFTSGAIDNWDHEGASVSEHDTVTVLYQDKPASSTCKPRVSDTQVTHGPQAFKEILPCQMLYDFRKPAHRPDIPPTYQVSDHIYSSSEQKQAKQKDVTWSLARLDIQKDLVSVYPHSQSTPSWSASNSLWTNEKIPEKNLAFLPVLPHPVTEYSTVYSAMKNFDAIGSQLVQNEIPMYCDEGVYCIVKEIQLMRPQEFRSLVPCLGTFHMVKTVLRCVGKAIGGSGCDMTWLQAGVFGPTVIQNSVLNGGHYNRCLQGMQLLAESFQRILYKEFFTDKGVEPYIMELGILSKLKCAVANKYIKDSQKYMAEFESASEKLLKDVDNFIQTRSAANENFKFWAQFLRMMAIVNDLLRADRAGIWDLHLDAVQRALYLFAAFDSTNYLRWCSVYLEDMRRLPETAPSVHKQFSSGNFSIKDKPGKFIAVGGDQKLEQSINLSSKCSDGVIGHAKQKQYVAQWDLIYHEMMAVKNLHRHYASVLDNTHESYQHHESSQSTTDRNEAHVQAMVKFIEEKGSPMSPNASETLQNFVTKELMPSDIREDILNALSKGKEKYLSFRKERFLMKTHSINSTIHRLNLRTMNTARSKPQKTVKKAVKEINIVGRTLEIARDRGLTTEDLLKYDVVPSPLLFDEDGMMTKPNKSVLVKEMEMHLKPEDYNYNHQRNAAFVIDVMGNIRKVQTTKMSTFDDLISGFLSLTCNYHEFGRCDYVFDIYSNAPSVKDIERKRRCNKVPVEYSSIDTSTPLPKDMGTFWPSNSNKLLVEKLIYSHYEEYSKTGHYPTVLGQISADEEWQCIKVHQGTTEVMSHLQLTMFEEADLRIPIHVLDSVKAGHQVCMVISNDTDVTVALLYHMPVFIQHGIEELWVRAGVGDTTRYLPLRKLFQRLGDSLCNVLPAVHSLTGCDITSKVGTKKAALKAQPQKLLKHFGRFPNPSEQIVKDAEMYLIKVLKPQSEAKNFSQLRSEMFHHSKTSSLHNLPPTSKGISSHIKRSLYNAYTMMHCMDIPLDMENTMVLKPEDYGYEYDQGDLIPTTSWRILEPHWSVNCNCTKCARSTCPCKMASVNCGKFCQCKRKPDVVCKNPFTLMY